MVPHATADFERGRSPSPEPPSQKTYKFPEFIPDLNDDDISEEFSRDPSPQPLPKGLPVGLHSSERWPGRRDSKSGGWSAWANGATRHSRQKSLSEAIMTVRARKTSISESAVEIAESLKAPISLKLVLLCCAWFSASILSNTSSKTILIALPKPITLTTMQFLQVALWCFFCSWLARNNFTVRTKISVLRNGIRRPTKEVILTTLPLTAFQIGGHILNSDAMARIPVSLVHTIKGLSPLMTVLAYRVFFDTKYPLPVWLSLVPLTLGVVMACSASFAGNFVGLSFAFGSTILFVTQNIVSKKIFNDAARAEADGTPLARRKPDKLTLLCYSSGIAFLAMFPFWLWFDGIPMATEYWQRGTIDLRDRPDALDHGRLALEFIFNGTFHFGQSMIAFILLGMVSPVTYSVASLIKRVAVIIFAIVWFGNPMTTIQGVGFFLTFLGLYLYDRTSDAARAGRIRERSEKTTPLLPVNMVVETMKSEAPRLTQSPINDDVIMPFAATSSYVNGDSRPVTPKANGVPIGLKAGTRAVETWSPGDIGRPAIR